MRNASVARLSLTFVLAILAALPAAADAVKAGDVAVYDAWARASAGPARTGAAYVTIQNRGAPDRLIGVDTVVALRADLHTHTMEGGVMKMRAVDSVAIGAGQRISLQPGGRHVMLMGLKAPLKEGETFPMTLKFERAGTVTVTVRVLKPGDMGPGGAGNARPMEGMRHDKAGGGAPPPANRP